MVGGETLDGRAAQRVNGRGGAPANIVRQFARGTEFPGFQKRPGVAPEPPHYIRRGVLERASAGTWASPLRSATARDIL